MKFSCDRCQTRYSIGDEKVRGKVLKIRCKTCGNIVVVREQTHTHMADQQALAAGSHAPAPQAPHAQHHAPPPAARAPAQQQHQQQHEVEWFVAIKGKQHGPAKKDDVARLFRDGKITERTYLWNESMAQWTRLREVPQFASLLAEAAQPKRPPPPPPSDEHQQHAGAEIIPFDEAKRAREAQVAATNPALSHGAMADPFAAVSAPQLGGDNAPRDSTRVFIMQAGLANRGTKHRAVAYAAGAVVASLAVVCALDYENVIAIPGLHNVVNVVTQKHDEYRAPEGVAWDTGDEDPKLKCQLAPDKDECVKKVVAENVARHARVRPHDIRIDDGFAVGGPGTESGSLHATTTGGGLAAGLTADERSKLVSLKHDEKKVAQVKLPTLDDAPKQVEGQTLDQKTVATVVKENGSAIKDCIEKAAKMGTVPHGKQMLVIGVEPNGRVSSARFKDAATQSSEAGECISKSARKWKFAPFPGPATDAEIPLILSLQ